MGPAVQRDEAACGMVPVGALDGVLPKPSAGRRARTLVASVTTVALAVWAHVAAEGVMPPVAVLLPVVGAVWMVSHWLTQRRIRAWHWFVLLAGTQGCVHVMASMVGMAHGHPSAADPAVMVGAHLVSTVITAAVLALGERLWWQILSWLRRQLLVAVVCALAPDQRITWALLPNIPRAHEWVAAGRLGMRAPPPLATLL